MGISNDWLLSLEGVTELCRKFDKNGWNQYREEMSSQYKNSLSLTQLLGNTKMF